MDYQLQLNLEFSLSVVDALTIRHRGSLILLLFFLIILVSKGFSFSFSLIVVFYKSYHGHEML